MITNGQVSLCYNLIACAVIVCEDLPNIPRGSVFLSGNREGSIATYVCDSGYSLAGDAQRTCQSNGLWSGREPSCGKFQELVVTSVYLSMR